MGALASLQEENAAIVFLNYINLEKKLFNRKLFQDDATEQFFNDILNSNQELPSIRITKFRSSKTLIIFPSKNRRFYKKFGGSIRNR